VTVSDCQEGLDKHEHERHRGVATERSPQQGQHDDTGDDCHRKHEQPSASHAGARHEGEYRNQHEGHAASVTAEPDGVTG
jgi:hypothetical protein